MRGSETVFTEMRRYVAFAPEDAALLREFRGAAAPHFERIAAEFYDRIRQHEEAHAVFTGEAQIARLQRSLVRWLERVFGGTYDEAYFAETTKIGQVHVRVGLPQRYMFTAMALVRGSLVTVAQAQPEGARLVSAIDRLLDLELAIMLESYRDDFVARIQHVERMEKAALGDSLARTEHRYVNAVELARVLIVGLDGAGVVRLFNREAEHISGFDRDEVLGRPLIDALGIDAGGDGARLREHLARFAALRGAPATAADDPGPAAFETAIRAKSGRLRDVRWHVNYAPRDGDDVEVFAIGLDVTDEKALRDRTRQQEKLAAIGTLAAGLAHEIRNPLNGAQLHITYLARSLKRSDAHAELVETVAVVADEIKRLGALVTEFLDFARPRPLAVKPVALQALFGRAAQLLAEQAASKGVRLEVDQPRADFQILGDGAKLEQVLLNLAQNAIEALAPGGGGRLALRVRRQPHSATIEVEDDGPGIPPGSPVFDAFYSTKPHGTGLGLSISHRIVTDHGGTLDVESAPGRTVFRLVLPLDGPRAVTPTTEVPS
jgi:PAS domain S-box-containing protein